MYVCVSRKNEGKKERRKKKGGAEKEGGRTEKEVEIRDF